MGPYDVNRTHKITSDSDDLVYRGFIAHEQWADPAVGATDAVHDAFATTTIYVAASVEVAAASAETDTLTVNALPATLGASGNTLSLNLTTAEDDTLAVSAEGAVITVALADTTATKNTAALIQAAIRALSEVNDVDVSAFTCVAGGNWDTAAIATGETAAVAFTGGQDEADDVLTTDITNPDYARCLTATAGGTAGDIAAIQVVIVGTDVAGNALTETLPAFTENTAGTVQGSKAFATVTSITIPAHDGTGATTAIGTNDKLGLHYKLSHNTVLKTYLDNTIEGTAPTVAVSSTTLASNTIDLNSALDGSVVDAYLIV